MSTYSGLSTDQSSKPGIRVGVGAEVLVAAAALVGVTVGNSDGVCEDGCVAMIEVVGTLQDVSRTSITIKRE
jgi:hypothetical protein